LFATAQHAVIYTQSRHLANRTPTRINRTQSHNPHTVKIPFNPPATTTHHHPQMSTPESSNSNPDTGTDNALVGISEIARMSSPPVFGQTIINWQKRFASFPKPEQPSPGKLLWRVSAIKKWLAATENERAPKVISFINLKGGVAKTTTSVAVAEMLA
jgi:hypothetical protein